ncbi:MAG: alpha-L-rhamnosidase [Clostridia bacterium]|nr:alpha-L-rhamnosidase [Clostridia bacterium]
MAWEKKTLRSEEVRVMYNKALQGVRSCIQRFDLYDRPILTVGPGYPGVWLEHNHDWMFFAEHDPQVAIDTHDFFYRFQSAEGQFPAFAYKAPDQTFYSVGYSQVQSVYPMAASAWYVARLAGDESFLQRSYDACARFDAWLSQWRDTRGSGLVEFFCEYDTGCDNSARCTGFGIPHCCPGGDARVCPESDILPVIAPDLSANKYLGRIMLSRMADALNLTAESEQWEEKAQETKQAIYDHCYDPKDEFFYDVDKHGRFRKYRTEHIMRMFMCKAVDTPEFEKIYKRYIEHPDWFGTPYPFPSIAVSDPSFNGERLANNWGGMSQSHTALETVFWMRQQGKKTDFEAVASIWLDLFMHSDQFFAQEAHPFTGEMSDCAPCFATSCIAFMKLAELLGYVNPGRFFSESVFDAL